MRSRGSHKLRSCRGLLLTGVAAWLVLSTGVSIAKDAAKAPAVGARGMDKSQPALEGESLQLAQLARRFLEAVASGDTAFLERHLDQDGQFVYIEEKEAGPSISRSSSRLLMEAVPSWASRVQERIWDPTVLIDGRIGLVWARYDYHLDGQFSHCGTDLFTFMKTDEGWLLTSGSWTIERKSCEESPLGPPKEDKVEPASMPNSRD